MKYMILVSGSQRDYDALTGRPASDEPGWTPADFAAMGAFMESFTKELAESGELVDTQGLTAPAHARRIRLQDGAESRSPPRAARRPARTLHVQLLHLGEPPAICERER